MTRACKTLLMMSVSAIALSSHAVAQDGGGPQLVPQGTILQRIVVSTGEDKVAIDTPQSVSVVTQDDIDNAQATTVGDVLTDLPGVKAVGSDRVAGESFNIRGIGTLSASDESRIIVQVDGVTKYYEQYRLGSFFSDPELYKRVEVLRGPASSTLYGSGALAGVITFTTKDATDFLEGDDRFAARLKTGFDSNRGGVLGSAIIASRLGENTDLLLAGNARRSDNFRDGDGDIIPGSEFEAFSGLAKLNHHFGEGGEQRLWASYQRWQSDENDTEYSQTGTLNAFGRTDRKITDQTAILGYRHEGRGNPWLDLEATLAYADTSVQQDDTDLSFTFGEEADYGYETFQAKVQNTFEFATGPARHYFTLGTQAYHQIRTGETTTGGTTSAIAFHPEGESTQLSLFAQDEIIWNRLTLIPGLRLDQQQLSPGDGVPGGEDVDFLGVSPKLAALYEVTSWMSVFGSVAHTERLPVLDEIYDTNRGRGLSLDLDPEKSNNFEGGLALSFQDLATDGDNLSLKGTAFYNKVTDLIESQPAGSPQAYRNVAEAHYKGIELEAAYAAPRFFVNAAYTLIRGEDDTTGEPLNSIPADELALTVGTFVPEYDLELGVRGVFAADQDRVSGTTQPTDGYAVFDVYAAWKPVSGALQGLEARVGIDNIFDRTYQEHLAGDPAKGRTFKVSIARTF